MDPRTRPASPRLGPVGAGIARRPVVAFVAVTVAVSWSLWAPGALGVVDYGSLTVVVIVLGGFGPLVAAAVITWVVGDSLRAWAGQVLRWRVRPRWYLLALGLPVAVMATTTLVFVALGNPNPVEASDLLQAIPVAVLPLVVAVELVVTLLLGGGQEELGWRGFALPRLLERVDAVIASLLIGAVWAGWHLPLFVLEGSSQFGRSFPAYVATLLALSVLFTWVYRGTGQSVLLVMLLHASYNVSFVFFPAADIPETLSWVVAAVVGAFAIGLVVAYGRELRTGGADDRRLAAEDTPPDV